MLILNSNKFIAYILSSLMLFMVVAISAPQMYSDVARPAYASQKEMVGTRANATLPTAAEGSNNFAVGTCR